MSTELQPTMNVRSALWFRNFKVRCILFSAWAAGLPCFRRFGLALHARIGIEVDSEVQWLADRLGISRLRRSFDHLYVKTFETIDLLVHDWMHGDGRHAATSIPQTREQKLVVLIHHSNLFHRDLLAER